MDRSLAIMDCTLRDGGYINDWRFGSEARDHILTALVRAGIDSIECGYLSSTKKVAPGMTRYASIEQVDDLLSRTFPTLPVKSHFCVMINHGEYDAANLPAFRPVPGPQIDGIRLAFHKEDMTAALRDARVIAGKGYRLFIQPMVTVRYSDREAIDLLEQSCGIDPFAVYIVDSFGSLHGDDFRRLFYLFENNVPEHISLGYHAHNNLQLAYSNAIDFLREIRRHKVIIDASIAGMGRGAGNLNTELLGDYLNRDYGGEYRYEELLEVIDDYLDSLYHQHPWGYSVAHFLSAICRCHPNYATYLLARKKLPVSQIHAILKQLPPGSGELYNEKTITGLYETFCAESALTANLPDQIFQGRRVVLVASGPSSVEESVAIKEDAAADGAVLVALNHIPEALDADYYFFSNQKRFDRFRDRLEAAKTIVTSNMELRGYPDIPLVVDYAEVLSAGGGRSDNVAILATGMLVLQGYAHVSIAGLDGYDVSSVANYAYAEPGGLLDAKTMAQENATVGQALSVLAEKIHFRFVTESRFRDGLGFSVCAVIPARYGSSRFEGKPLAVIAGMAMLERTYRQAQKCKMLDRVVVATDDVRIEDFCKEHEMDVVMTSSNCLTGTDRVAEVADQVEYDLYVNVQGDEPVIDPRTIDTVISEYAQHGDKYVAYNLYKRIEDEEDERSPTIIKTVVDDAGELVYMSRLPVPFSKAGKDVVRHKQVCVYGFSREALHIFSSSQKTANEAAEDIEILRFRDLGYRVRMIETDCSSIAVDVPTDIAKVEAYLSSAGSAEDTGETTAPRRSYEA